MEQWILVVQLIWFRGCTAVECPVYLHSTWSTFDACDHELGRWARAANRALSDQEPIGMCWPAAALRFTDLQRLPPALASLQ